jgi:hypothetical protein
MKTTTKALIFSIALIPTIMLISSFTKQTTETKYATIRTVEAAMGGSSKIILAYEGKTEELDLDKGSVGNMTPNTLKINQAINILASKGYELVAQSGGDYISMYSFVKK